MTTPERYTRDPSSKHEYDSRDFNIQLSWMLFRTQFQPDSLY